MMVQILAGVAALLFTLIAGFQTMLAAGQPWGRAAWGGAYPGVLPRNLRIASGVTVVIWLLAAAVVLEAGGLMALGLGAGFVRPALWVYAAYLGFGAVMNGISRSKIERMIWTPIAAACCVCCLTLALLA